MFGQEVAIDDLTLLGDALEEAIEQRTNGASAVQVETRVLEQYGTRMRAVASNELRQMVRLVCRLHRPARQR